jgi:hypothetical protein
MTFNGVRSSWDMTQRKLSLAWRNKIAKNKLKLANA